ncbi:MAG TPA: hypothetical protein DDW42_01710 [Desulfobacteraceae bacterium]|nr:hypothetical protein [Desulfobacteraceae bacterium]
MKWKNLLIGLILSLTFVAPAMAVDKVIEFTWQHADPVAQDVVKFTIYMSSETGANYIPLFDIPFVAVEGTYTAEGTITVPDNQETTRYFVATAVDGQGNESSYSNEVNVTIDNVPPDTPITFKAVVKVVTQ